MQLLGVGYLLLIAGTVVVGARLIMGAPTRAQLWAPVAILGVGAMAAYAFTRVVSTPLDNQDVGNWACTLGMAALFLEAALMALSAYAIVPRSRARKVRHPVSDRSTIASRDE
jgi:tellurite resistance protein TehA-like permease